MRFLNQVFGKKKKGKEYNGKQIQYKRIVWSKEDTEIYEKNLSNVFIIDIPNGTVITINDIKYEVLKGIAEAELIQNISNEEVDNETL